MKSIEIYEVSQLNKKITNNTCTIYPNMDNNGYRLENREIYECEKRKFFENGEKCRRTNDLALLNNKVKLDFPNFLKDINVVCQERASNIEQDGNHCLLLKKRSIRQVPSKDFSNATCCLEPWFKKYLIFNKFVRVARLIVYRERLLKSLGKLKKLDKRLLCQYEKQCDSCNVSYADIFEPYILQ